ncbi:hypothetical protein LSUE1_G006001 [Lachnellula suecica]|uniref:BZIP domain-containing protein n=1 Tax=Lachnellula suecica TaxID=602035 RepID=A0A8T9C199_9HELO|nr:hypothetical protein LSUE1_G006001 [Lachnellula suecica]
MAMENSYTPHQNYPQDDYALAILTQAAMHTRTTDSSHPGHHNPTSGLTATTTPITNHHHAGPRHRNTSHQNSRDLPNNIYNPLTLPPADARMEALAFNPSQAGRHNAYMDPAFKGIGNEISRNYANNLGILNAESYSDHAAPGRRFEARKEVPEPTLAFGMIPHEMDRDSREEEPDTGARRRKKPRIEANSADDDEESRKKSRGRPRVDTKDETAADRRRTQIRMAQRAYRHRKETTISSLEKQVQGLRGTNEEMSNIFISLYDFAVGKGLLQREPEFGQQLQSTTERFLALAKASSEDLSQDEIPLEDSEKHDEPESGPPKKKGRKSSPKSRQEPKAASPGSPVWGGFPIGKSQTPIQEMQNIQEIQMDYQPQSYENKNRQQDLQVITRPTEDNASFPWDFMDLQQYRVEVPSTDDFSQMFLPEAQLELPSTHSYGELSFARRLQRGALEAAVMLVSMPNPPPGLFESVFGFSLKYETREQIVERTKKLAATSAKESLQNWRAPFVNLGRAGTFYPMRDTDVNESLMPKIRTGYSMGPFSETITQAQDEYLDENLQCSLPGFEGEFFDSNDVDGYLRGHGFDISPTSDFVTVQIDLSSLSVSKGSKCGSESSVTTISPNTPKTPIANLVDITDGSGYKSDCNTLPFPLGFASWDNDVSSKEASNIDPIFYTMTEQHSVDGTPDIAESRKRSGGMQTITFNVDTLLREITARGVCLSRSPGYRPSDINAAIVAAANSAF